MKFKFWLYLLGAFWLSELSVSQDLTINQVRFVDAPNWLTEPRLQFVVDKVQNFLEWDIRRITVKYYPQGGAFQKVSPFSFKVAAFYLRRDGSVHLGPEVNNETFDRYFGHELVHVIFAQKYKSAIPSWLEEGLANFLAQSGKVEYAWLAKQNWGDVYELKHPSHDLKGPKLHYQVSTALIEMISRKCSLPDLLRLSVGAKMTTYLSTYCEIKDLNMAFKEWVKAKADSPS